MPWRIKVFIFMLHPTQILGYVVFIFIGGVGEEIIILLKVSEIRGGGGREKTWSSRQVGAYWNNLASNKWQGLQWRPHNWARS